MKTIELRRMDYEAPTRDTKGRPTYCWRTGWLAKNAEGRDLYPPEPWPQAEYETRRHNPGANVVKGTS